MSWSDCGMCGQECQKPCMMVIMDRKKKFPSCSYADKKNCGHYDAKVDVCDRQSKCPYQIKPERI